MTFAKMKVMCREAGAKCTDCKFLTKNDNYKHCIFVDLFNGYTPEGWNDGDIALFEKLIVMEIKEK